MEKGLEEIQTDIHDIEEDVKKNCSVVYDLIVHTIKCITVFVSCCCRPKSA